MIEPVAFARFKFACAGMHKNRNIHFNAPEEELLESLVKSVICITTQASITSVPLLAGEFGQDQRWSWFNAIPRRPITRRRKDFDAPGAMLLDRRAHQSQSVARLGGRPMIPIWIVCHKVDHSGPGPI